MIPRSRYGSFFFSIQYVAIVGLASAAVLDATLGQVASLGALDASGTIVFVAIQGDHLPNVPPCGDLPLFRSSGILPPPEARFHTIIPAKGLPSTLDQVEGRP